MKFLYILVSNERDIYFEQTLVSILSLRHYNPNAWISLIVDDATDRNLEGFRASVKEHIQEYIVAPFPSNVTNIARSRLLKTSMRKWISGDFLYLDGDTAIVAPLDLSVPENCHVGAIADLHASKNDAYHVKHKRFNSSLKKLGFSMSLSDLYFNGGVIYAKDSENARVFFDTWHKLYQYCNEHQIYTDQFSFNESNHQLGFPLHELPGEWNCQVREAYNHLYRVKIIYPFLCRAKIIHFFGSGIDGRIEPHPLMKNSFFEQIKRDQGVNEELLSIAFNSKTAFYGAPNPLNSRTRFPLFFIYRQHPLIFRIFFAIKKFLGK